MEYRNKEICQNKVVYLKCYVKPAQPFEYKFISNILHFIVSFTNNGKKTFTKKRTGNQCGASNLKQNCGGITDYIHLFWANIILTLHQLISCKNLDKD